MDFWLSYVVIYLEYQLKYNIIFNVGHLQETAMNSEQLNQILQQTFTQADIHVTGDSGKYELRIVDDIFEGKRTVERQKMVYQLLNDYITSGAVHAVTIRAMTKEEWRKVSVFGV